MLTLLSVGKRVFLRYDAANDARLGELRAAVKGKKVGKRAASNGA